MIAGFARLPFCALGLLALFPLASCDRSPVSPASPQVITPIVTPVVVTLSSIAFSASAVDGGIALQGTATLSAAAPSSGTVVTLTSNNAAASVPASITVAAGTTSGTFTVATVAVTADTDITITGAAGGVTRTAALRIAAPGPSTGGPVASFTATHDDIIGGQGSTGTVTLSAPAPAGGVRVSLESDDRDVTVPAMLTFAAGAISASFNISTAPVTVAKDVRLTATFVPSALRPAAAAAGSVVFVLRLLPVAPPSSVVTLTGVSPNLVVRGNVVDVQLTGTNFQTGATVQINGASILITDVIIDSATLLRARFFIDGDAAPGARTITVTTAAGTSGGQTFTLLMQGPQPPPGPPLTPTLTNISPSSDERGQGRGVTLTGTSFTYDTTVQITGPSTSVFAGSVVVNSTTSLSVILNLDSDAAPGPRTVTVTTAGGTSNGLVFTVLMNGPPPPPGPALPPTLTGLSPASGVRGVGHGVRLTGTNFVYGATVAASGPGISVSNVIVESTTSIAVTLSIDFNAAPGPRTITVTTPAGTSGGQTFTVTAAPEPSPLFASFLSADRTALRDSRARIRF